MNRVGHARDVCPSPIGMSGGRIDPSTRGGMRTSNMSRGSTILTGSQAAFNWGPGEYEYQKQVNRQCWISDFIH